MDSTETAPGLSAEAREPNGSDRTAIPETVPGLSEAGNPADSADAPQAAEAPPQAEATGDTAVETSEGAPRPRRRRRRRRRPEQAATAAETSAANETVSGEAVAGDLDAPAHAVEAASDPAAASESVEHGGAETPAHDRGEGAAEGATPDRPVLRLRSRNRRRRRRPPVLGLLPGHTDPIPDGEGAPSAIAAIRAALAPGQRSFSVPRRQRRHAPLAGEPAVPSSGEAAARDTEAGGEPAHARRRRRRRPTDAAAPGIGQEQTAEPGSAARPAGEHSGRRGRSGPPRQGSAEDRRAPDASGRGPGRGGPRDRGDRRDRDGRGAPPRRVEQKLYSVDAIVDRGFEDVEEDGGETRRLHWTILKRTTADQISRKPVSAVYVLQRDGADTEYPSLGTARSAVNKTIVHPEKLTPSKAERAIAKK